MATVMKVDRPIPPQVKLRIGSEDLATGSGGTFRHVDPATGKVQCEVPLAGIEEMNRAVEYAAVAFDVWRRWKPADRRDALLRLADLLDRHADEFAVFAALENGSPVSVGGGHARTAAAWTRYYAGWADKLDGSVSTTFAGDGEFTYTVSEPYGVIGCIITWNGPLTSLGMKVAPALAAGNTVVVKPSEITPFGADLYARLVRKAGIPDGVCNIVPGGIDAGEALVRHPKVQKITFTGGPVTARKILATCSELLKPAVLELGGKSANLIFDDADLDRAINFGVAMSVERMSGQGCAFASRMLVQRGVYKDVLARVVARVGQVRIGDPFDRDAVMGPVVNEAAMHRILGIIERTKASGAGRLLIGGKRAGGGLADGFYIESTVFADVDPDCELAQSEVFGPVLSIIPFDTEADAIAIANNTQYGLAAYVNTRDVARVHRVAGELQAGSISVNGAHPLKPTAPFGGHGLSGYGREGGRQGIEEFVRPKTVQISQF